jgi:hypothetical protein
LIVFAFADDSTIARFFDIIHHPACSLMHLTAFAIENPERSLSKPMRAAIFMIRHFRNIKDQKKKSDALKRLTFTTSNTNIRALSMRGLNIPYFYRIAKPGIFQARRA